MTKNDVHCFHKLEIMSHLIPIKILQLNICLKKTEFLPNSIFIKAFKSLTFIEVVQGKGTIQLKNKKIY